MGEEKKKVGAGFGVMVLRHGKILLGQRHIDPEKADSELSGEGTWTMPGGKMEYGESFEKGAYRELKEETGMEIKDVKVITVENSVGPNAQFITVGMVAEDATGEPKIMEPDEITKWEWFDINNLPKPMFPPSQYIIDCYKKGVFYKND